LAEWADIDFVLFPYGLFFRTLSFGSATLSNLYANINLSLIRIPYGYTFMLSLHRYLFMCYFSRVTVIFHLCYSCWSQCYQLNLIVIFFWIQLWVISLVSNLTIPVLMHIKLTCIH